MGTGLSKSFYGSYKLGSKNFTLQSTGEVNVAKSARSVARTMRILSAKDFILDWISVSSLQLQWWKILIFYLGIGLHLFLTPVSDNLVIYWHAESLSF